MGPVDQPDTPVLTADDEIVAALMATYGLTEEQARYQHNSAKSWKPDLVPPPAPVDPSTWLTQT